MADGKGINVRISGTGGRNTRDSGGVGHNPPPTPQSVKPGFPGGKSK